jgi:AcrR family transcriptional regulator
MTNKPVDRRIQRTRQLLQGALVELILEKGYEAVTVQDVIDRANVGRATFYAHFQDREALLLSEFEILWSEIEQHLTNSTDDTTWDLSLLMFRHAQNYHRVYKAVVGKQSGHVIQAQIHAHLTTHLRKHLESQWAGQKNEIVPLNILAHYLVSSFMTLLIWWLDNDLPYSAERMDKMYRQLAKPGVDAIWEAIRQQRG